LLGCKTFEEFKSVMIVLSKTISLSFCSAV
jgi:hypothetical protein